MSKETHKWVLWDIVCNMCLFWRAIWSHLTYSTSKYAYNISKETYYMSEETHKCVLWDVACNMCLFWRAMCLMWHIAHPNWCNLNLKIISPGSRTRDFTVVGRYNYRYAVKAYIKLDVSLHGATVVIPTNDREIPGSTPRRYNLQIKITSHIDLKHFKRDLLHVKRDA